MDDPPILQMKELVFATPLRARDARTAERAQHARRNAPAESGMEEPESRNDAIASRGD